MADAATCDVTASFAVALDRAGDIEQRLQRLEGSQVDLLEITGAEQGAARRSIGLTESFMLRFPNAGNSRYELRYRVRQPDDWAYRCPVWLPAVAADRPRNVEIEVTLPPALNPPADRFLPCCGTAAPGARRWATCRHSCGCVYAPGEPRRQCAISAE